MIKPIIIDRTKTVAQSIRYNVLGRRRDLQKEIDDVLMVGELEKYRMILTKIVGEYTCILPKITQMFRLNYQISIAKSII